MFPSLSLLSVVWGCVAVLLGTTSASAYEDRHTPSQQTGISVDQFHVETKIAVRFASTTIASRINNRGRNVKSADFILQLPDNAYIANFSIEVNGITYYGRVRDKCEGEDENTFDASGSLSSGRISHLDSNRNTFMVSVSVAPRDTVAVMVNYQELLERVQGWFTQRISLNPQQVVNDFRIRAYITEPQGIIKVESGILQTHGGSGSGSSGVLGESSPYASLADYVTRNGRSQVTLEFSPTSQEQLTIAGGPSGIDGDFVIRYDVRHDFDVGHVQKFGSTFVHHFSPGGLTPIRKSVAFVIDVSASMFGRKLNQTKQALLAILDQMRAGDRFNIITFSDEVYHWIDDEMVSASPSNIKMAKNHVKSLIDLAGTNLNDAMIEGLEVLRTSGAMQSNPDGTPGVCILFVLTDGKPSKGVTDTRSIESNVRDNNQGRCSVITLGFGHREDVDFNFLARLALGNNGVARKIFQNSEVSEQLIGVYDEVATPLLLNVAIEYLGNVIERESLTKTFFRNYFDGSEFVISGRLANLLASNLLVRVVATNSTGEMIIEEYVPLADSQPLADSPYVPPDNVERSAAFILLSQLFNQYTVSNNAEEKKQVIERALDLSKQYNLLTPLMSMSFSSADTSQDNVAMAVPSSLRWGISGAAYSIQNDGFSRPYGIGGRVCTYEPEVVIDLERLHIESLITDRYARTNFISEVVNKAEDRQDVPFLLHIPPGAFISSFSVILNGEAHTGQVGDIRSNEWQQLFSAGDHQVRLLTRSDPTKDTFTMRVLGVAPQSSVTFNLTYDELLERRRGVYEHRINLWPGQVVDEVQVDIYMTEPQGIAELEFRYDPRTSQGESTPLRILRSDDYTAHMYFSPSQLEQEKYTPNGLQGDLVLEYDVLHSLDGSYTEVQDGYFVHFLSPSSYERGRKHVVFVIDVSSSMVGTKLRQVKEALDIILDDLRPNDRFNILVFSDNIQYWRRNALLQATGRNIEAAKIFVQGLVVQGETNLGEAIIQADHLLDLQTAYLADSERILSMMYVLSDGQPTIGLTDPAKLVRAVRDAINGEHALFCLGFGRNVSFDFLAQMGLQNRGYSRRIYETADASKQLQSFYFEVSRPVIFDVEMTYGAGVSNPDKLSKNRFPFFFEGSELSVAGQLFDTPSSNFLQSRVRGVTASGQKYSGDTRRDIRLTAPGLSSDHAVQKVVKRIWTMKMFKDLINQFAMTEDPSTRQTLADQIADLAIRNNFVTPLTPMYLRSHYHGRSDLRPPSLIHTGTTMDILRGLLEDLPVNHSLNKDLLSVATETTDGIITKSLTIDTQIVLRFATTVISSRMENQGTKAGWAVFRQKIPLLAFITDVTLFLNGKTYRGEADHTVEDSILQGGSLERGHGGGFITELDPENKVFVMSVRLEPGTQVKFSLTYQMLLIRRQSMFHYIIGLHPGQVVSKLRINVTITEPQGVRIAEAYLNDRSRIHSIAQLPFLVNHLNRKIWHFKYQPTTQQQQQLSADGIMGDLIVKYDVIHANNAGDIQVLNDYFVQFFSPTGLPVLHKHVIFVIDISSSMEGTKLAQVKTALKTILEEISPGDKFNILPFSNQVEFLDRYRMVEATPPNIHYAKSFVDKLHAKDGTNLNDAILEGVNMLRREMEKERGENGISMLVVLTDGEPTFGELNKKNIELNVQGSIQGDFSLFCLAFGEDADLQFLKRLALKNHGIARRISERADASAMLEGFYDEVATPLLFDLVFYYSEGVVPNTLSERYFANYFNGSEIVIVGKLDGNRPANHVLRSFMYSKAASNDVSLAADSNTAVPTRLLLEPSIPPDLLERIWAYVTIMSLERKMATIENQNFFIQKNITDKSLRYSFLNPYTRMTVREQSPSTRGAVDMSVWEREVPLEIRNQLSSVFTAIPDAITPSIEGANRIKVHLSVCFDINGRDGDVISLVKDRVKGVYINGKFITESVRQSGVQEQHTSMGEIGATFIGLHGRDRAFTIQIRFTPSGIFINANHTLTWDAKSTTRLGDVVVKVEKRQATVSVKKIVEFTVLRYLSSRDRSRFMGIFLNEGSNLSEGAQGLIGQFGRGDSPRILMRDNRFGGSTPQFCGRLQMGNTAKDRPVYEAGRKKGNCFIAANIEPENNLIQGELGDYLVSDIFTLA